MVLVLRHSTEKRSIPHAGIRTLTKHSAFPYPSILASVTLFHVFALFRSQNITQCCIISPYFSLFWPPWEPAARPSFPASHTTPPPPFFSRVPALLSPTTILLYFKKGFMVVQPRYHSVAQQIIYAKNIWREREGGGGGSVAILEIRRSRWTRVNSSATLVNNSLVCVPPVGFLTLLCLI